jgi:pyrimidine-nucleoside phosphorylase
MYDIIDDKKNGRALSAEQLAYFVKGVTDGTIPDYQSSALLMAMFLRGLDAYETFLLTDCMAQSGDMLDLSAIPGIKVDKHSTGGVGDKTTLIVAPLVAACGVPVAKMSGRGLGFTGGTIDKLEAIPGFTTSLSREDFFQTVKKTGCAIISQTAGIAQADKKLYALRDVTATVDSIPLIASSVMSKKLASGADAVLLDVKLGSGAFMKSLEDAIALASLMVRLGERAGKKTAALITNMDIPLGMAIGNALEVSEVIDILQGGGPSDLREVCTALAANMLELAGKGSYKGCHAQASQALADGSALKKFAEMVAAQHGDAGIIKNRGLLGTAPCHLDVYAQKCGFISGMDTEKIGAVSVLLGAGRKTKEDQIDRTAGVLLHKKRGDQLLTGDRLATLYSSGTASLTAAAAQLTAACRIEKTEPRPEKMILAKITAEKTEIY